MAARAEEWLKRLRDTKCPGVCSRGLYTGDHWSKVLELEAAARASGFKARVWVCSAGYGLVSLDTELKPYAATFAPGQADSVVPADRSGSWLSAVGEWWEALASWRWPDGSAPRRLATLASRSPRTPLLVALSKPYLEAIKDDLVAARRAMVNDDLLVIVSTGSRLNGELSGNLLPSQGKLRLKMGGALHALNARIVLDILANAGGSAISAGHLRIRYKRILARIEPMKRYDRTRMTDEQVREFARKQLSEDPTMTASRALRLLRDSGRACEQRRFGDLFREVKEQSNGLHA